MFDIFYYFVIGERKRRNRERIIPPEDSNSHSLNIKLFLILIGEIENYLINLSRYFFDNMVVGLIKFYQ